MSHRTTEHPETVSFGLLPDATDYHVHAVHDATIPVPGSVCGVNVLPDICDSVYRVTLCRRCLIAVPDGAELRPACRERLSSPRGPSLVPNLLDRRSARRFDRRIRRALDARRRRHG